MRHAKQQRNDLSTALITLSLLKFRELGRDKHIALHIGNAQIRTAATVQFLKKPPQ